MSERPVECNQCKKSTKIIYKEIIGHSITVTEMCPDCPTLLKRLHGVSPEEASQEWKESDAGLFCGHCHTPLESIKMGNPMGCKDCYATFGDVLMGELIAENKLPKQMQNVRRNQPLHIGKTPGKPVHIPASNRLTTLNEALNEALQQENYEEAAWLRDQINQLTNKSDDTES